MVCPLEASKACLGLTSWQAALATKMHTPCQGLERLRTAIYERDPATARGHHLFHRTASGHHSFVQDQDMQDLGEIDGECVTPPVESRDN